MQRRKRPYSAAAIGQPPLAPRQRNFGPPNCSTRRSQGIRPALISVSPRPPAPLDSPRVRRAIPWAMLPMVGRSHTPRQRSFGPPIAQPGEEVREAGPGPLAPSQAGDHQSPRRPMRCPTATPPAPAPPRQRNACSTFDLQHARYEEKG